MDTLLAKLLNITQALPNNERVSNLPVLINYVNSDKMSVLQTELMSYFIPGWLLSVRVDVCGSSKLLTTDTHFTLLYNGIIVIL